MKMYRLWVSLLSVLFSNPSLPIRAQGTFQNLDFESANVPGIPPGQYGGSEPISNALPYWVGYIGPNQVMQIQHNNLFAGTANISIVGPDWTFSPRIDGAYTVVLQPGSTGQALVDVSIGQTGLIPAGAESIRFKSDSFPHSFAIAIGGQSIPVVSLGIESNHNLYGADVSAFAGLTQELLITAQYRNLDNGSAYLDSIIFSNQPIPEPSTLGLFALGALLLGWRWRVTRKP